MGQVTDIGTRIELVSMDPHFEDISIALYEQEADGLPRFLVQSYSQKSGSSARLDFIVKAMAALGGLETDTSDSGHTLHFPCGARHVAAMRRLFLECCKLSSDQVIASRPLKTFDKKADAEVTVVGEGNGQYRLTAAASGERVESRVSAITAGLVKLGEM